MGVITIGPWALALIYDMILYLFRAVAYEIPFYGGRAQGRQRPQAPTLKERPNGRKRTFSLSGLPVNGTVGGRKENKRRSLDSIEWDETEDITEDGQCITNVYCLSAGG